MNSLDFFLAAMAVDCYKLRDWIISAFSLVAEGPEDWKADPYPYRIVQTPDGIWFVNPEDRSNLIKITDAEPGKPPFVANTRINLKAGQIPNLDQDIETTYGRVLFNYMVLVYPFGNKIPYQNKPNMSPSYIENLYIGRFQDTPPPGAPRDAKFIYADEHIKCQDAFFSLPSYSLLWVPTASEKALTAPDNNAELKASLIEQNKDTLRDPATIAGIAKALQQNDAEYLKGDESEGFLITDKSRKIVRSKLFLMMGGEAGFEDSSEIDFIPNSLTEGWQIEKIPAMYNTSRAGSYNRGAQTQLGGEAVKSLLRASSNLTVTIDDCGSRLGIRTVLTPEMKNSYLGNSVVTKAGHEQLTEENFSNYLGKEIMVRSPQYCVLDKTDYCKVCVGPKLAMNPTGLSVAVSDYGNVILLLFMKAMHGKELATAKMDYRKAII